MEKINNAREKITKESQTIGGPLLILLRSISISSARMKR